MSRRLRRSSMTMNCGGSSCIIAMFITSASILTPLRGFRDNLNKTNYGKKIVSSYYSISKSIIDRIG